MNSRPEPRLDTYASFAYLNVTANVQVTRDTDPRHARSESALAIDPGDGTRMVGASKMFLDAPAYRSTVAVYFSRDAGRSWQDAEVLTPATHVGDDGEAQTAVGITDPVAAFDFAGDAFVVGLAEFGTATFLSSFGVAVYQSGEGGATWGAPELIHWLDGDVDDKPSIAVDTNRGSPHRGNIYVAWDKDVELAFALSAAGEAWTGVGGQPAGTSLNGADGEPIMNSFAPQVAVAADGTVHIAWLATTLESCDLLMVTSTDGGWHFSPPQQVVTGITSLDTELPGGGFLVATFPNVCAGTGQQLVVAWADMREGVSRIYYRSSADGGAHWSGPDSGQPLSAGLTASRAGFHDFHPQLTTAPGGEIGCAFYEFGQFGPGPERISTVLAISTDEGSSFPYRVNVTDQPWDPAVDAPDAGHRGARTFIGDYFGLAAGPGRFAPFWTDTRTGIQEIFTATVGFTYPFGPTQHVIYLDSDGHVQELWWEKITSWHVTNLITHGSQVGAPAAQPGSPLAGYVLRDTDDAGDAVITRHVLYVDGDGHLQELWWDGASWHFNDLTIAAGAQPVAGRALAGYTASEPGLATQHVIFIDEFGLLEELRWDRHTGWHSNRIAETEAAPDSPLAAYVIGDGQPELIQNLAYLDRFDRVIHLAATGAGGAWQPDVPADPAGAPDAAAGSPLAAYVADHDGQLSEHLLYVAGDRHVHQWHRAPGGEWQHQDITGAALGPGIPALVADDGPVTGYTLTDGNDLTQNVIFVAEDRGVWELRAGPDANWQATAVSAAANAPDAAPGSPLTGYVLDDVDAAGNPVITQHVMYLDNHQRIQELWTIGAPPPDAIPPQWNTAEPANRATAPDAAPNTMLAGFTVSADPGAAAG